MSDSFFKPRGTTQRVDKAILKEVAEFARRLKIVFGDDLIYVLLFGSCARGTNHVESDVDIALILTPEGKASFSMKGDERSYACDDMELEFSIKLGMPISLLIMDEKGIEKEKHFQTGLFRSLAEDSVDLLDPCFAGGAKK